MSNLKRKSWLAWLLVPLFVYGSLMAYWATKIVAGVWPDDWTKWQACGYMLAILLMGMGYSIRNGSVKRTMLWMLVIAHILTGAIVVVTGVDQTGWGEIDIDVFSYALVTLIFGTSAALLYRAIRF